MNELIKYLETEPRARERANKDRAIINLLLEKNPNLKEYKEQLIRLVGEYSKLDRYWRKILEERPDLRGSDYLDKRKLEEAKIKELDSEVKRSLEFFSQLKV